MAPPDAPRSDPGRQGPEATRAPIGEEGLGASFRRDLAKAREGLERLLRGLHRARRAAGPVPDSGVPSRELIDRFSLGLAKEHDLVLAPLLQRLEGFGTRLVSNEMVPPELVEEGLALVDRYVNELHDVDLHLLELAYVDPPKGAPADLPFEQLSSEHTRARVRWATVRVMLRGYEKRIPGYQALLGLSLAQEASSERAWHDFESEYVRSQLPATFSHKVAESWIAELGKVREAGRADRGRVDEFLARSERYALRAN